MKSTATQPIKLSVIALSVLLAACAAGPDYTRPAIETPAAYSEAGDWLPANPSDAVPRGTWWSAFNDATLNQLMDQLNQHNPSIEAAEAGYRQAQAALDGARAAFWPTIGISAGEQRGKSNPAAAVSTTDSLQLQASWAPDLWGKVRRSSESGQALADASASTLAATRLSTQATLAQTYFSTRVADKQAALLQDAVSEYERALKLTQNQFKVGTVTEVDVLQARTQLDSTRAALSDIDITRAQLRHALAVLVGKTPAAFALQAGELTNSAAIPTVGIPSTLLERRPDIAAAERKVASLNAQIGVSKAAWFPSLTLGASTGYSASTFSHLISAPNRIWSFGPQLAEALFDGGNRKAQTAAARAAYDAGVASYKSTVLNAFREVEDNLVALRKLDEEIRQQQSAVDAARKTATIVMNQYKVGTVSYLNVVTAQTARLSAERSLMQLHGRQLNARVGLVTSLGG
ncbi:efflux transporter outer membrane subunit [Burkholderiaceae bacterium DAT-1]|nr:efflux transporter outer membrane subunit [Burkholderiaceae bacterium DAT-1]